MRLLLISGFAALLFLLTATSVSAAPTNHLINWDQASPPTPPGNADANTTQHDVLVSGDGIFCIAGCLKNATNINLESASNSQEVDGNTSTSITLYETKVWHAPICHDGLYLSGTGNITLAPDSATNGTGYFDIGAGNTSAGVPWQSDLFTFNYDVLGNLSQTTNMCIAVAILEPGINATFPNQRSEYIYERTGFVPGEHVSIYQPLPNITNSQGILMIMGYTDANISSMPTGIKVNEIGLWTGPDLPPPSLTIFAGVPRPVPELVMQDGTALYYPAPAGEFQSNATLTWILSPDDPDQINGSFNYTLYQDRTTYPTGWLPSYNLSHSPVTGHPGWVTGGTNGPGSRIDFTQNGTFPIRFNMTVTNTAISIPNTAQPSCMLFIDAAISNTWDQCGSPILNATSSLSAFVARSCTGDCGAGGNPLNSSEVDVEWKLSDNDSFNTVPPQNMTVPGIFYCLKGNFSNSNVQSQPFYLECNLPQNFVQISPGIVGRNLTESGSGDIKYQFQVQIRDILTNQRSNWSCSVFVTSSHTFETNTCGGLNNGQGISQTAPVFPMFNLGTFASTTGIPLDVAGFIVAAIFILALTGLLYYMAGIIGALSAAALGVVWCVTLNLIPYWTLILAFMFSVSIIVTKFKGSATE